MIVLQFGSVCDGVLMFFCSSGALAEYIVGSFGVGSVLVLALLGFGPIEGAFESAGSGEGWLFVNHQLGL